MDQPNPQSPTHQALHWVFGGEEGVTYDGGDGDGDDHYETEFRFEDSSVVTSHPPTDYIGDFS